MTSAENPESGEILYEYDNNGNLTEKTDARSIVTTYVYDALNRVTERNYTNEPSGSETADLDYTYGTTGPKVGKLTKVESSVSTTEFTGFDILGRVTASKQTTDGTDYTSGYTYNLSGALIEQTYPSGRVVRNVMDSSGDLSLVQSRKNSSQGYWNYANSFTYNAAGAVTSMQLGNGRWESTTFNSRLQPTQIALGATPAATNLLDLDYSYGTTANNGNVLSQTINFTGLSYPFVQSYSYDALNRLDDASETYNSTQTWRQDFTFDRYGNRNFNETNTTTLPRNCGSPPNFTVCTADKKVFNPAIDLTNNRLDTDDDYAFDSSGNTTADAQGRQFIYDAENKQVKVLDDQDDVIGEYWYDGDGKRVRKHVPLTGEVTVFVHDASGKLVAEYSTIVETTNAKVGYVTNDHLGSPRINTDANGGVTSRHDYHPFGEEISTAQRTTGLGYTDDSVRKQFTGYERDNETELDFAQARYYRVGVGRFTSTDPIVMTPNRRADPQQFNLYVYVRNNPYAYVDPSGEVIEYSSDDARDNLDKYRKRLEECGKKCENELNTLNRLVKSDVTYVINLKAGKDNSASGEGELSTDGTKVFVNIDNVGGPTGEQYSINARLGHELEHARQFEDGELSFFKGSDGKWVGANYDLSDEVKAHAAMIGPGYDGDHLARNSSGSVVGKSTMGKFAAAATEEDRLGVIRASSYGSKKKLSDGPLNFNPHKSIAGVKKPGELVRTDNYFGRIHSGNTKIP